MLNIVVLMGRLTADPELRCRMLGNRFAGEALKKAERLNEAAKRICGQQKV